MTKKPDFQTRQAVKVFFREWRLEKGLTQQQLADRLGTSKTRVSMKERGKEGWDNAYLAALAEALGIDEPATLLMRDPTNPQGLWTIWDQLKPATKRQAIELLKTLQRTDQAEDAA